MSDIYIEDTFLENQRLVSHISNTPDLDLYFKSKELFLEYDTEIYTNQSILNIPLIATILPLAWLTGSNVNVQVLDKGFKESMDELQKRFAKMFPKGIFSTEIKAKKLVDNTIGIGDTDRRTGLLFSGGVDSTYTLIKNMKISPRLVMIWGCDNFPYPGHLDHWEKTIKTYKSFAKRKKLDIHIIKTNITQILNDLRIEHKFHKVLYDGNIKQGLQHSLVLLPAAAPLSVKRFDKFLIAASFMHGLDFNIHPRAALPELDETIKWANLSVEHHGFLDRTVKIIDLSNHMKNEPLPLRVCV